MAFYIFAARLVPLWGFAGLCCRLNKPCGVTMQDIVVNISYRFPYTCRACGKTELGTRRSGVVIRADSLAELEASLGRVHKKAHDMPYGWASYYGTPSDVYSCGCDRKEG